MLPQPHPRGTLRTSDPLLKSHLRYLIPLYMQMLQTLTLPMPEITALYLESRDKPASHNSVRLPYSYTRTFGGILQYDCIHRTWCMYIVCYLWHMLLLLLLYHSTTVATH